MQWRYIEQMAKCASPEKGKPQFYFTIQELTQMLGANRNKVAAFLRDAGVPHYAIGRGKTYFLPEVIEAVEATRWAKVDGRGSGVRG